MLCKPGLFLVQLHFVEGTSGRPSGEVSRSFYPPSVYLCVGVHTGDDSGWQAISGCCFDLGTIHLCHPSGGGILVDPNEVREGIVGDWGQSPHTRRWKSHG